MFPVMAYPYPGASAPAATTLRNGRYGGPMPPAATTRTISCFGGYRGPVQQSSNVIPPKQVEDVPNQAPIQITSLVAGLKDMQASAEHADLMISCKGYTWKVHKVILCAQSEYFRKGLSGRFREAQEGVVALEDEDPVAVDAMLHYFYHLDYIDYVKDKAATDDPFAWDVKMFFMADRYLIDSLKHVAAKNFQQHADTTWNKQAFCNAVRDVYDHFFAQDAADNLLKKAIIHTVKRHQGLLVDDGGCSDFLDIISTRPDLGKDVAIALAIKTSQKYYKCPGCGFVFSVEAGVLHVSCPNQFCNRSSPYGGSMDEFEIQQ